MQLLEELKKGENKTLEFKEKLPDSDTLVKTIIAFSNTSGGKLIIGVNDEREVVGLKDIDIFDLQDKIASIIYDKCYPHILPEIYTLNMDNILNIVSPGGFPNTLTQQDILEGRSEVRNKVLARVFKELGYIEQWGSGIKRIKFSCIQHGLKEPLIQEKGDFVDVELYRLVLNNIGKVSESIGKVSDNFNSNQEKEIIIFIEANEKINSKEVETLLSVKEARARRILKEMTEKTLLERKGSGRSTFYVLFNGTYR